MLKPFNTLNCGSIRFSSTCWFTRFVVELAGSSGFYPFSGSLLKQISKVAGSGWTRSDWLVQSGSYNTAALAPALGPWCLPRKELVILSSRQQVGIFFSCYFEKTKNTYCWCSHAWHWHTSLFLSLLSLRLKTSSLYLSCSYSFSPASLPFSTPLIPSFVHSSSLFLPLYSLILVLLNRSINICTIYYFYDINYIFLPLFPLQLLSSRHSSVLPLFLPLYSLIFVLLNCSVNLCTIYYFNDINYVFFLGMKGISNPGLLHHERLYYRGIHHMHVN